MSRVLHSEDAVLTATEKIRHSAAHILAAAVVRLFPDVQYDIGPAIENGFYYDFDLKHKITTHDLAKIEAEMRAIVRANEPFEGLEVSREKAEETFRQMGQTYKLSRLESIPEGETITLYRNGNFVDLCRGPHVPSTGAVKAFKLLNVAGCYHRGDSRNPQLQRIYGCAFSDESELKSHLARLELAQKRDHRRLGTQLQLYHIDDRVGPGLILWTARGTILRGQLQAFISEELERQGYVQVSTPHIGKLELFRISGHFPYYKDSQFAPIVDREAWARVSSEMVPAGELFSKTEDGTLDGFLLKPMNCPMHVQLYASQPHSYRELPIRMAEFGTVYRWEQSGELGGLTRVRGFTQDDAHIFCTEEQLETELGQCLELVKIVFGALGMTDYRVRISLRDPSSDKYIGEAAGWEKSENALRRVVNKFQMSATEAIGEAAFYGPKIDFTVKDVLGRSWQLGTVQVDYNLPQRFALQYIGADNRPHVPVMIHRAPFGSLERFCGLLIEHFGGDFPLWLAPEQVRILTVGDAFVPYAKEVYDRLKEKKIRVYWDDRSEKLGAKIRRAEEDKIPYLFILGEKEEKENTVSIRSRIQPQNNGSLPINVALELLQTEIVERRLPTQRTRESLGEVR